ncbi:MAG: hypothetical protein JXR37_26045 [Kiritimatiellae bacterium]|nr:hypothetical protein [Kiritimatiellia bacterium]
MECGLFYHETPVYWVVDLLMPQDLKEEVLQAGEYVDLEGEMHEAIMGESPGECEFDPGFDWHAGKERLDKLIAKWRKKYGIEPKP